MHLGGGGERGEAEKARASGRERREGRDRKGVRNGGRGVGEGVGKGKGVEEREGGVGASSQGL